MLFILHRHFINLICQCLDYNKWKTKNNLLQVQGFQRDLEEVCVRK